MLFSSLIFLFSFLPFILIGNYLWQNRRWQNILLFIGSLIFYAWGEGERVAIMILSVIFNYYIGRGIGASLEVKKRKAYLTAGIVVNLLLLFYFKYAFFVVENLNAAFLLFKLDLQLVVKHERLPIGISFYTFQCISYIIDVFRKENKAQKNFIDVGLYIALFPQLIAGPIVRYHDIAAQLRNRITSLEKFSEGVKRFVTGLGKKVLIADTLAFTVDEILAIGPEEMTTSLAWLAMISYAMQIYFDFSGYSDMAIGLGKMLGFDILENFNFPYISRSVKEFWKRWHISLSNWFMDYLYIPLGGNRSGRLRTYRNLVIVFLITGFWHGASWNFVIWGMIHGTFMILEKLGLGGFLDRMGKTVQHIYTLLVVVFAWAFFRIEDISYSWQIVKCMWGFSASIPSSYDVVMMTNPLFWTVWIIGLLACSPFFREFGIRLNIRSSRVLELCSSLFYMSILFLATISLVNSTYSPFIYFRF